MYLLTYEFPIGAMDVAVKRLFPRDFNHLCPALNLFSLYGRAEGEN